MQAALERKNMALGQLYTNDIASKRILQAMAEVPREFFVPAELSHCAYTDSDLAIGNNRYLIAPLTLAKLLDMADITPSSRVLVIGALSGYVAAITAKLTSPVFATEIDPALAAQARDHKLPNVDIQLVKSLADGHGTSAPYDVIVIPGAIDFVPDVLGEQLSLGGRLVAVKNLEQRPGLRGGAGRGLLVKRINNQLHYREHFDAASELLPGFERVSGFAF